VKALPERASGPSLLEEQLARLIANYGPISVADYMAEANAHYYATRDPLGRAGDFITAPEISQMFGELVGLWLADLWERAGSPAGTCYVELGPGRGTLAADALRAMRSAGFEPNPELIETSPVLRQAQAARIPGAHWHDQLDSIPHEGPLLIVANEFFDALPVRQLIGTPEGWRERKVDYRGGRFVPVAGPPIAASAIPDGLREAPTGAVLEVSPASIAIAQGIAHRLAVQGGAALIIDYGHARTGIGETLQAVHGHAYADPWSQPGERDLTAHVDFGALAAAVEGEGVRRFGPVDQGRWLAAIGVDARAASLARHAPDRAEEIATARHRLTAPDQMGSLFKVMALVAPDWPEPVGFA